MGGVVDAIGDVFEGVADTVGDAFEGVTDTVGDLVLPAIGATIGYTLGGPAGAVIGGSLGLAVGGTKQDRMANKFYEQSLDIQEATFALQKSIIDELYRRLPEAEETIKEGYGKARESARKSFERVLSQAQMNQNVQNRLLSRVGASGFLSAGALENAYRASSEALGQALLGAYGQLGSLEAQLFAEEATKLAALPVEYLRGATGALGISPSLMGASAQLIANKPDSFFDRLMRIGSVASIFF